MGDGIALEEVHLRISFLIPKSESIWARHWQSNRLVKSFMILAGGGKQAILWLGGETAVSPACLQNAA